LLSEQLPRIVKIPTKSTWVIFPTAKVPAANFTALDFARIETSNMILFTFRAQSTRLARHSISLPCTYAAFDHAKGVLRLIDWFFWSNIIHRHLRFDSLFVCLRGIILVLEEKYIVEGDHKS
jgi:hypothetical protein